MCAVQRLLNLVLYNGLPPIQAVWLVQHCWNSRLTDPAKDPVQRPVRQYPLQESKQVGWEGHVVACLWPWTFQRLDDFFQDGFRWQGEGYHRTFGSQALFHLHVFFPVGTAVWFNIAFIGGKGIFPETAGDWSGLDE